jgi:hypothetical protein
MKDLLESIATKALINRIYNYSLWERLYTLPDKNLLSVTKGNINDHLTFPELVTTPFTMTRVDVFAIIKGKYFLQYQPPMKSGSNTWNPNKFCLFHHNHRHNIEKCHAFTKKDRKIDFQMVPSRFVKKEIQYEQTRNNVCDVQLQIR